MLKLEHLEISSLHIAHHRLVEVHAEKNAMPVLTRKGHPDSRDIDRVHALNSNIDSPLNSFTLRLSVMLGL